MERELSHWSHDFKRKNEISDPSSPSFGFLVTMGYHEVSNQTTEPGNHRLKALKLGAKNKLLSLS